MHVAHIILCKHSLTMVTQMWNEGQGHKPTSHCDRSCQDEVSFGDCNTPRN